MPFRLRRICLPTLLIAGYSAGLAAQAGPSGLSSSEQQKAEVLLRTRVDLPPASKLSFKLEGQSEVPDFNKLSVHFSSGLTGTGGDLQLLLSKDGSRLAQFATYPLLEDPRTRVEFAGRPARGGSMSAPVVIVNFDDLECPHCASLHRELFPALTDHYKDQVRVVYQSMPSDGHPWAMRAAIDTDCLGAESAPAYWAAVDTIHEHATEFGGKERQLAVAQEQLDAETLKEAKRFHVDEEELKSCLKKQDDTPERKSTALASSLGVRATPTVFINGAKIEGEVPLDFVFDMVDNALRAEGKTPPARESGTAQPAPLPASK